MHENDNSQEPPSTATWLYTRRGESVLVEVRKSGDWLQLTVSGPHHYRLSYLFASPASLLEHQAQYEAYLLAQGFVREPFTGNRRSGKDRRRRPRLNARERRRS